MLATIVQLDPIYVNFNISEQDVLRIRAEIRKRGLTPEDLKKVPVEIGLQTEARLSARGHLDYASPTVDTSTGTLAARAVLDNPQRVLLPGMFVRVRVPTGKQDNALLVPDAALGTDQSGRYLLVVDKDNVVEQRSVDDRPARRHAAGDREGPQAGRPRHRQRHVARDSRPEGRSARRRLRAARREVTGGAMISKFFIERPVLANVIAILMVVIGAVALFALPVAQYPDVVPPTVQVTTRYPGASARTVIDTVALPIEQQVNGVEGMIYMQSYAAADGTYSLTVTFKIGTDLNFAQVLVQNRVSSALSSLPQRGADAGRDGAEEIDLDPADRHVDLARRALRQPVSWRTTPPSASRTRSRGCPASATSRCSAPANMPCASGSIRRR